MNSTQTNSKGNWLDREKVEHYRNTTDQKVKHSIEREAMDDPFAEDALEGWSDPSLTNASLRKLDSKFNPTGYKWVWIAGGLAVILVTTGLLLFDLKSSNPISGTPAPTAQQNQVITLEKTDLILPEKIEAMVELPVKEQITAKKVIRDFTEQQKHDVQTNTPEATQGGSVDQLPLHDPEISTTEHKLQKERINGKEIYLFDMKLLDYRAYRSRPSVTTKQMILTGTPANVGEPDQTTTEEEPEWKDVEVPYIDYLEKTMELFSKGYNKKALSRFLVILEAYPDDVNAGFYAGLCYFNLKEYGSATRSFNLCLDSKYANFAEEAEWYLAKSLLASGEKEKGREILQKIAERKGYYSKQAEKLLK